MGVCYFFHQCLHSLTLSRMCYCCTTCFYSQLHVSEQCHLPAFSTHSQEEAEGGGWAVIYSTVKVGPPDVVSRCVNKYTTHSTAYINTTCCWRLLSLSVLCCHHHCQSRTRLCYGQSTHSFVLMALVSALLAFVLNFKY